MTKRDQANLRQSFDDFGALVSALSAQPLRGGRAPAHDLSAQPDGAVGAARRDVLPAPQRVRRAANRAKSIVENYPQSPQAGDALAIMVESYKKLGQDKLADDAERVLKLNYPDHPYLRDPKGWPNTPSVWRRAIPLSGHY